MDTTVKYCDIFKCVDCPKLGDCCDGDPDDLSLAEKTSDNDEVKQ